MLYGLHCKVDQNSRFIAGLLSKARYCINFAIFSSANTRHSLFICVLWYSITCHKVWNYYRYLNPHVMWKNAVVRNKSQKIYLKMKILWLFRIILLTERAKYIDGAGCPITTNAEEKSDAEGKGSYRRVPQSIWPRFNGRKCSVLVIFRYCLKPKSWEARCHSDYQVWLSIIHTKQQLT